MYNKQQKKSFPAFSGLCVVVVFFVGIWKQQNNQTLIYHEMLDLITMKRKYTTIKC